MTEAIQ